MMRDLLDQLDAFRLGAALFLFALIAPEWAKDIVEESVSDKLRAVNKAAKPR